MAEPAPTAPRRRWPRRLAIAALLLVAALLAAWMALGDRLVCAVANRHLPVQADGLTINRATRGGVAPARPPQVEAVLPPGRARGLAAAASGWWLPPGALRHGMAAEGAWFDRLLAPELPLDWTARLDAGTALPRVAARLDVHALNRLLARVLAGQAWEIPLAGTVAVNATLRSGSTLVDLGAVEAGDAGPRRRFRFAGGGSFDLTVGNDRHWFTLPTLVALLQVDCTPVPGGWRPLLSIEPEEVECQPRDPANAIANHLAYNLKAYLAMPVVDQWLNDRLRTAELVIPAWAPLETAVRVEVE